MNLNPNPKPPSIIQTNTTKAWASLTNVAAVNPSHHALSVGLVALAALATAVTTNRPGYRWEHRTGCDCRICSENCIGREWPHHTEILIDAIPARTQTEGAFAKADPTLSGEMVAYLGK